MLEKWPAVFTDLVSISRSWDEKNKTTKQNPLELTAVQLGLTISGYLRNQKDFSDFSLCGQKDSSDLGGGYLISEPPPGSAEISNILSSYFGTLTVRDGEKEQIICLIYAHRTSYITGVSNYGKFATCVLQLPKFLNQHDCN